MQGRIRWIAPLIGALVVVGVVVAIAPAAGPPRTLDLVAAGQRCSYLDLGRKGAGIGDEMFCRAKLRAAAGGAAAGSVRYACAYLGSEGAGDHCTATARLEGGTLELAGKLSHTSAVSEWAVIGGTGSYADARGRARLRQSGSTSSAVTITLLGDG